MRYSILFITALVLVSGFIAYFGDLLGRKMGKKRLTLFNMRPRYTAIVVTTITGMLISTFVMATLVSVNAQFRKLLTEGEFIIAQNKRLSSANVGLESQNKLLVARGEELKREVAKRRREVDEARKATAKATRDMEKATRERDKAVAEVARLEKDIAARQRELKALQARTDAAESELKKQTRELKQVQSRLLTAQASLERAQSDLRTSLHRLTLVQTQLDQAEQTLEEQETALNEQRKQIEEQTAALVELGKKALLQENRAIEYQRQTSELRSSELAFRQGDEIMRGVISPRQSIFGIRGDLYSLLDAAGEKAKRMGAKEGSNGRAVSVVPRLSGSVGLSGDLESLCIDMIVRAISDSPEDMLVQVICERNTLGGEQVPVEVRLYRNTLLYRKGGLIAGTQMDGRTSEGRILLSIIDFLQKEVSQSALRAGIIPISNPDPRAALGQDPKSQVESLMAVVERVKSMNARVKVDIYACADIYAAGPLNMDNMRFGVTKVE